MPDVRMPDGTIIRNVPEGATREQIQQAYQRARAAGAARPQVSQPSAAQPPRKKSNAEHLWDGTKNVLGGFVEGLGSVPDAITLAASGGLRILGGGVADGTSAVLRATGFKNQADKVDRSWKQTDRELANPVTISRMTQWVAPTPQNTSGKIARFGASLMGGAAYPQKLLPPIAQVKPQAPRLPQPQNPVIAAGQRQNVPIRKPDVDPSLYNKVTRTEASAYGGPRIQSAYNSDAGLIQSRASQLASGTPQDDVYNLGGAIQKDAKDWIERTGRQFQKAYSEVDTLSQGAVVKPQNAIQAVDNEIADLTAAGSKTNKAQIDYLRDLRDDLMNPNGFTMRQFQGLVSANKARIRGDTQLTSSDASRRLGNIVTAFSDDASTQLPAPAVNLLKETDAAYAQRQNVISNILQKHILGKRNAGFSPEKASDNFIRLTRGSGDQNAVNSLWPILNPQTQADLAATRTAGLGLTRGGEFQMGRFATDTAQFPKGIRATLLGDEGAASLEDLATIARAKSNVTGAFNNSRTGVTAADVMGRVLKNGGAGVGVGLLTQNPILGGVTAVGMEGARYTAQNQAAKSLLKAVAQEAPLTLDDIGWSVPRILANPAAANDLSVLYRQPMLTPLAADQGAQEKRKKR